MAPLPSGNYKAIFDSFFQSLYTYPKVKRVVYHEPATIVFWTDDTKTVVKCIDGQPYEKYAGFCAAVTKKILAGQARRRRLPEQKIVPSRLKRKNLLAKNLLKKNSWRKKP